MVLRMGKGTYIPQLIFIVYDIALRKIQCPPSLKKGFVQVSFRERSRGVRLQLRYCEFSSSEAIVRPFDNPWSGIIPGTYCSLYLTIDCFHLDLLCVVLLAICKSLTWLNLNLVV